MSTNGFLDGILDNAGYSWKWASNLYANAAEVFLILGMLVLTFFIQTTFPLDANAQRVTGIYQFMLVLGLILQLATGSRFAEHAGVGESGFLRALAAGLIAAGVLVFVKLSIAPASLSGDAVFWTVAVASIAETYFFQNSLAPTISELTGSPFFGILWANVAFGVFHFFVSGGNPLFILTAFVFGVVISLGNGIFKSTLFGYSLHAGNNFLFLVKQTFGL